MVGKIGGTVKVATVYSVGLHELPAKVRRIHDQIPGGEDRPRIFAHDPRRPRRVLNGTVELGVLAFPEPRRGLTMTQMPDNRLVLIARRITNSRRRNKYRATDLNGLDFVLFERDMPTRKATDKILKAYGVEVKKVAEFDNIETIKRAVEVGFGLAIVPLPSIVDERDRDSLPS